LRISSKLRAPGPLEMVCIRGSVQFKRLSVGQGVIGASSREMADMASWEHWCTDWCCAGSDQRGCLWESEGNSQGNSSRPLLLLLLVSIRDCGLAIGIFGMPDIPGKSLGDCALLSNDSSSSLHLIGLNASAGN
jgi:hypothetical protein